MFTTLTIAMTLTGAVPADSVSIKAEAIRPALIQVADRNERRFGNGTVSSGNRNRRFGDAFNNGGPGIFGANLATPPGGKVSKAGSGKGSNHPVVIGKGGKHGVIGIKEPGHGIQLPAHDGQNNGAPGSVDQILEERENLPKKI